MRTPTEALKELRDRLTYFCARMDGRYDPPWATELVGIIDDALANNAPTTVAANMAECRSALEAIAESARSGSISTLPSASLVLKTCEGALKKPPRQCDVGTAEEQAERFDVFCNAHKYVRDDRANCCPCYNVIDCGVKWAQMPYEKGGEE